MKRWAMKQRALAVMAGLIGLAAVPLASGQAVLFDSGSDGSDGPLVLAANENRTIDLGLASTDPGGGNGLFDEERFAIVFHFEAITIGAGARLKFINHPLNPPVVFLSRGDVIIRGTIEADGQPGVGGTNPTGGAGGPGGYRGGRGHRPGFGGAEDGLGPGGGGVGTRDTVGSAGHAFPPANARPSDGGTYGTPLLVGVRSGGSGGGGRFDALSAGGGGGGSITIASNTRIGGAHREWGGAAACRWNRAWRCRLHPDRLCV